MSVAQWQAADHYRPGGTLAICDRCGRSFRLRQLRKEWTGLMVCQGIEGCYDPPPRDATPPRVYPEGVPVPNARPDPGDVLGPNTTTTADL